MKSPISWLVTLTSVILWTGASGRRRPSAPLPCRTDWHPERSPCAFLSPDFPNLKSGYPAMQLRATFGNRERGGLTPGSYGAQRGLIGGGRVGETRREELLRELDAPTCSPLTWSADGRGGHLMDPVETVLRARRVVTPGGTAARWVGVRGGRIAAVLPYDDRAPAGARVEDLGADDVLLPGLVDTHVHVNDPGRTEWEGFGPPPGPPPRAASPPWSTCRSTPCRRPRPSAALARQAGGARGPGPVDVGFWGGAVPGNLDDLRPLHDAGVVRLQVLPVAFGRGRVPAARPGELRGRARRDRRLRRPADRARRGPARSWRRPRAGGRVRGLPRLPAARRREHRDRRADRAGAGGPARGCTSCTCPSPTRCR